MKKEKPLIIGIDNGTTGAIAVINNRGKCIRLSESPTFKYRSYNKEEKFITRIDKFTLTEILYVYKIRGNTSGICIVLERPMVNPGRFANSLIAVRAYEATLIALEENGLPYYSIDSRTWQHALFGKIENGNNEDLKKKAKILMQKKYSYINSLITNKTADALCIAHYAKLFPRQFENEKELRYR